MRLPELRDHLVSEFSFPVGRERVMETVGDVELDAPAGEPESVAEVLDRTDQDSFRSADELYDTLVSYLGEQYIGRKYYDDRGVNVGTPERGDDEGAIR